MMHDDPHRVLARNAACHQCRRRKLKCDATRPTCGNCRKPRQRGPEKYEPPEPCTWDEARDPSARTLRRREALQRKSISQGPNTGVPGSWHMGGSESPPQHHQQLYQQPQTQSLYVDSGLAGRPAIMQIDPNYMNGAAYGAPMSAPGGPMPIRPHHGGPMSAGPYGSDIGAWSANVGPHASNYDHHHVHQQSSTATGLGFSGLSDMSMGDSQQFQLVFPEWPRDLPSADVVFHIVQVFFERVSVVPKMLHRASFVSSLRLPPQHSSFPAVSLIHAIIAITAPYLAPDAVSSREYFPIGTSASDTLHPEYDFTPRAQTRASLVSLVQNSGSDGTPLHRFQMWHRRKALENLADQLSLGTNLLQAAQTMVTVTWVDIMNGWWTDMWMESANAVRLALPMHLNVTSATPHDPLSHNMGDVLPEAQTALEQAQRDRTWWMIYVTERISSFGTLWPPPCNVDDITVELPVNQTLFDQATDGLIGVQTFQSPKLLAEHPSQHIDPFPLLVKTVKLFADTINFMRRYSRGQHSFSRYLSDSGLRKCLDDINTFRQYYPPNLRRPMRQAGVGKEAIDPDLFYCLNLTHGAVINLGGPLISRQTWSGEAAKMILQAIRAVLSLIYDLDATSFDITLLSSVNAFIWYLAGRCLVRFQAAARQSHDHVNAEVFEGELQTIFLALQRLGQRHPSSLRYIKVLVMQQQKSLEQIGGEIIPLNTEKQNIFDTEFGANAPRKTASSGSVTNSPTAYVTDVDTPTGSNRPAAANGLSPAPGGVSPHPPQRSAHISPIVPGAHSSLPRVGQQRSHLQQPSAPPAQSQSQSMYPQDDLTGWFKTDGFDINSYSFDVDAMSQLLARTDPTATFDGSMLAAFPSN